MTEPMGPPLDPRVGRQRWLLVFLRASLGAVAVLGVVDLLLPQPWKDTASVAMVVALIAVPAIRILWLTTRWVRKGDRRFAAAGLALLLVMASGLVLGR